MHLKTIGSAAGILLGCLVIMAWPAFPQQTQPEKKKPAPVRIGPYGIVHRNVQSKEDPVTPSPENQKKKEIAERLDTAKLLSTGRVVVDKSPKMLEIGRAHV